MARTQFTFTFTNAQPGSDVHFSSPVYADATTVTADGPTLVLSAGGVVSVWADAGALIAYAVDGNGTSLSATATARAPSVTSADGTPGQNPFAAEPPDDFVVALMNPGQFGPLVSVSPDGRRWSSSPGTFATVLGGVRGGALTNLTSMVDRHGDTVVLACDLTVDVGTVIVSTDGGATWSDVTFPCHRAWCVYYDGTQWVFGVGDGTHAIVTSPDLANFTIRTTPFDGAHNVACVTGDGTALIAGGDAGGLIRSTNGGVAWTAVTSDFDTGAVSTIAAHGGLVVAVGQTALGHPLVATSADHGATWTTRSTPDDAAFGVFAALTHDGTHWWVAGLSSSNLYKSTDGITWTLGSAVLVATAQFAWVMAWDGTDLWVGLDGAGGLLRSSDGGATWQSTFTFYDTDNSGFGATGFAHRHAPARVPARP